MGQANISTLYDYIININLKPDIAIDLACVIQNIREHVLLHIPISNRKDIEKIVIEKGLIIEAQRNMLQQKDPNTNNIILSNCNAISKNNDMIAELWICNPGSELDHEEIFNNPGKILGYPNCCVKKYESMSTFKSYYDSYFFSQEINYWEINRIASFFTDYLPITNYFPCKLSCKDSQLFSKSILNVSKHVLPNDLYNTLCNFMRSPIIVANGTVLLINDWGINNKILTATTKNAKSLKLESIYNYDRSLNNKKPFVIPFNHFDNAQLLELNNKSGECISFPIKCN